MAVTGIGMGVPNTLPGTSDKSSKSNIEDTIKLLERKREEYKKQNDNSLSDQTDKKISDLDNRIKNLRTRLDKMKAEEEEDGECETCKNRKYQDESDDPGVSFKTASKVGAGSAEAAVRGHEYEHVNRNQAKAEREGKEIVYQSVVIKRAICPECGKSYVSGGETKTVTREKRDERFDVGLLDKTEELGKLFDAVA